MKIAFDVDDTLIIPAIALEDEPHPYIGNYGAVPNYEVIAIFKWFQAQGNEMIVWSGGGIEYAKVWADKLGLQANVVTKGSIPVDIAFDDCDVKLGTVNVKVKRVNNSVSRAEWNKTKH